MPVRVISFFLKRQKLNRTGIAAKAILPDYMLTNYYDSKYYFLLQSLVISSRVLPFVSGTIFQTKIAATIQITP